MASEDLFAEEHFTEEDEAELKQFDNAEEADEEVDEEVEEDEETENDQEPVEISADTESNETDKNDKPEKTANQEKTKEKEAKLVQLPLSRVRNLMKLDPDFHIATTEAVFMVTKATELFIESIAKEAYSYTVQAKKKTIQKRDIDLAVAGVDSLLFLDGALNF